MSFLGYEQTNNLIEPYLQPTFLEDNMADFNGAKPVMTARDNEFKISLVDGASGSSATKLLSIVAPAEAFGAGNSFGIPMMVKDASGNAQILELPLAIRALAFATDTVDVSGSSVTVSATNLDIRDLVFATDKVDVSGSSVTIPNLTFATDSVDVSGSSVSISGSVTVTATDLDIRNLAFATDTVDVSGSSVTVSATDLDIRNLASATDSVTAVQGTSPWVVSGSVSVVPQGGKVCDYKTTATVGVGAEVLHMYVVTNTKTFTGNSLLVGARGAVRVRFGISNDGIAASTVKGVYFQDPKENRSFEIDCLELLGDGTKAIFIAIQNTDGNSSDVHSTLQGFEV